jgi:hypothetical protein
MNENTRIQLTDNTLGAVVKLADGNPGAITALFEIMKAAPIVDPQSVMRELGVLLSFDTHGIYGASIYILWNDVCKRDARSVLVLLRSVQLGIIPESELKSAAEDEFRSPKISAERMAEIDAKVCEQLEEFQRPSLAA